MGLDEKILSLFVGSDNSLTFQEIFFGIYKPRSKIEFLWYRVVPMYEIDLHFKLEEYVLDGILRREISHKDEFDSDVYKFVYTGNSFEVEKFYQNFLFQC